LRKLHLNEVPFCNENNSQKLQVYSCLRCIHLFSICIDILLCAACDLCAMCDDATSDHLQPVTSVLHLTSLWPMCYIWDDLTTVQPLTFVLLLITMQPVIYGLLLITMQPVTFLLHVITVQPVTFVPHVYSVLLFIRRVAAMKGLPISLL